jgi:hypothetical protein
VQWQKNGKKLFFFRPETCQTVLKLMASMFTTNSIFVGCYVYLYVRNKSLVNEIKFSLKINLLKTQVFNTQEKKRGMVK